jgi:hypothetical protein
MKMLYDIQPRAYKWRGKVFHPKHSSPITVFNADILKNKEIRIYGTQGNHIHGPQAFDKIFSIGDEAEYGSYNLIYTGTIVGITDKQVTIEDRGIETCRLKLFNFIDRNWDFDAARVAAHNAEERFCI